MCHPNAGNFPEDPAFALLLLTTEAYGFDQDNERVPIGPLGNAVPYDDSFLPDAVSPRVREFIKKVVVYKAHNVPFDEDEVQANIENKVLADGIERDTDDWEDACDNYWSNFWSDKEQVPWAMYRIWVTNNKWISHLEPGQSFDSAAYSEDGPYVDEERNIDPERRRQL